MSYALDAEQNATVETATMGAVPSVTDRIGGTVHARVARDLLGSEGQSEMDLWWTCHRGTAPAAAAWRTALAAGWYEVTYDCDQARGHLAIGDVVQLTDTAVGFSAVPAQIAGIVYRDSGIISLSLVVWRSPAVSSSSVSMDNTPEAPVQ